MIENVIIEGTNGNDLFENIILNGGLSEGKLYCISGKNKDRVFIKSVLFGPNKIIDIVCQYNDWISKITGNKNVTVRMTTDFYDMIVRDGKLHIDNVLYDEVIKRI